MFSDILLTVDFDRTLTAPDSTVPEENIKAIEWFMANGGAFTINTGRSVPMCKNNIIGKVPVNVPLLVYNGSAAYDVDKKEILRCKELDADPDELMADLIEHFPDLIVEVQGLEGHHVLRKNAVWEKFNETSNCPYSKVDKVPQPLIKLGIYTGIDESGVPSLYVTIPEEQKRLQEVIDYVDKKYGDKLIVFRACPRLVDIHQKGCSKLESARTLQKELGRKILICVGDGHNDLPMMEGADYAFCPADGAIADRFPNVCNCAEGAVAEVIYKKIPEICASLLTDA